VNNVRVWRKADFEMLRAVGGGGGGPKSPLTGSKKELTNSGVGVQPKIAIE
jgi:hypothetical protein